MLKPIHDYYNSYNEDERLASRHGQVEFLTTMRYIERYLKPDMKILDIGAGTGRYSFELARLGYSVDAVELVERNVEIFKSKITEGQKITVRQGDALNLSLIKDNTYDITLLLGPMYHLFDEESKLKALSEAIRVTKKSGIIFVAYCVADASIVGYGFVRGHIFELIENKLLSDNFEVFSRPEEVFELHRKEDIISLTSRFNINRLHYVATDLFTNYMRDTVDAMDECTFDLYLKYHYAVCEREDMVGITNHSLDILQK